MKRELDDVLCKLISLESGGPVVDSILSNNSLTYDSEESDDNSEDEPVKHSSLNKSGMRTPVLPTPSQVRVSLHR